MQNCYTIIRSVITLGELQDGKYGSKYIDGLDEDDIDCIMYCILTQLVGRLSITPERRRLRSLTSVHSLVYICRFPFPFLFSHCKHVLLFLEYEQRVETNPAFLEPVEVLFKKFKFPCKTEMTPTHKHEGDTRSKEAHGDRLRELGQVPGRLRCVQYATMRALPSSFCSLFFSPASPVPHQTLYTL